MRQASKFSDEQAAFLVAAGRLIQAGGRRIERLPGERYPAAVLRVVANLPAEERERIRELSRWVREYEKEGVWLIVG